MRKSDDLVGHTRRDAQRAQRTTAATRRRAASPSSSTDRPNRARRRGLATARSQRLVSKSSQSHVLRHRCPVRARRVQRDAQLSKCRPGEPPRSLPGPSGERQCGEGVSVALRRGAAVSPARAGLGARRRSPGALGAHRRAAESRCGAPAPAASDAKWRPGLQGHVPRPQGPQRASVHVHGQRDRPGRQRRRPVRHVLPGPQLLAPSPGAIVTSAPKLRWTQGARRRLLQRPAVPPRAQDPQRVAVADASAARPQVALRGPPAPARARREGALVRLARARPATRSDYGPLSGADLHAATP